MSETHPHRLTLQPIGAQIEAAHNTPLRDLLFEQGVEFPCGGQGRCRGCKVRVVAGEALVTDSQREHLTEEELADGWRLACQCTLTGDLTLELRQWDAAILSNDSAFAFTPRAGLGVAVDIGTTTVVAQLLDLQTGQVLAVKTALNPQARFGGDVMSRVQHAATGTGAGELATVIRREVGKLIRMLVATAAADGAAISSVVMVGNTVMHHLFCGIDIDPLSHYPFEPVNDGLITMSGEELGWESAPKATVSFLPCLGGFVGSDILAGILATGIQNSDELVALVDLGTNGEIVLSRGGRMLCASTAAGPAFEGARISVGMRASTGAIWRVTAGDGALHCEVLGNAEPRGVCGSGLVDAIAAAVELGMIRSTGRLASGAHDFELAPDVSITQTDIRQLQLAKGAIAAGIRLLLARWGATSGDLTRLYLAGAFGNYVDRNSARRIGLLAVPEDRISAAGNTALLGAKIALFAPSVESLDYAALRNRMEHVSLNEDREFQDVYVEEMLFPAS